MRIGAKYEVDRSLMAIRDDFSDFKEHILRELSLSIGDEFYKECRKSGTLYPYESDLEREHFNKQYYSISVDVYPSDILQKIKKEVRDVYNDRIDDDFVRTKMNKISELLNWVPEVKEIKE